MFFRRQSGFTLVEIMIIVLIIGLLAAIAIPAYYTSRVRSQATNIANNLRVYSTAFEIYATENGTWPVDTGPGAVPTGMEGELSLFTEKTVIGGYYDWEGNTLGVTAGISLYNSNGTDDVFRKVDEILDDGNLSTGRFKRNGGNNRVTLVLEE